ncbi:hypothetical protein HDU96_003364 [Phlyctochytrium bullatum]|nr:hypothetical protein HDU96_003364 [Phlyctochytrium bullatum]
MLLVTDTVATLFRLVVILLVTSSISLLLDAVILWSGYAHLAAFLASNSFNLLRLVSFRDDAHPPSTTTTSKRVLLALSVSTVFALREARSGLAGLYTITPANTYSVPHPSSQNSSFDPSTVIPGHNHISNWSDIAASNLLYRLAYSKDIPTGVPEPRSRLYSMAEGSGAIPDPTDFTPDYNRHLLTVPWVSTFTSDPYNHGSNSAINAFTARFASSTDKTVSIPVFVPVHITATATKHILYVKGFTGKSPYHALFSATYSTVNYSALKSYRLSNSTVTIAVCNGKTELSSLLVTLDGRPQFYTYAIWIDPSAGCQYATIAVHHSQTSNEVSPRDTDDVRLVNVSVTALKTSIPLNLPSNVYLLDDPVAHGYAAAGLRASDATLLLWGDTKVYRLTASDLILLLVALLLTLTQQATGLSLQAVWAREASGCTAGACYNATEGLFKRVASFCVTAVAGRRHFGVQGDGEAVMCSGWTAAEVRRWIRGHPREFAGDVYPEAGGVASLGDDAGKPVVVAGEGPVAPPRGQSIGFPRQVSEVTVLEGGGVDGQPAPRYAHQGDAGWRVSTQ